MWSEIHLFRNFNNPNSAIDTALHFTFYRNEVKVYSVLLMESVRFYVFYIVCFYFTKKAANLLTVNLDIVPPPERSTQLTTEQVESLEEQVE